MKKGKNGWRKNWKKHLAKMGKWEKIEGEAAAKVRAMKKMVERHNGATYEKFDPKWGRYLKVAKRGYTFQYSVHLGNCQRIVVVGTANLKGNRAMVMQAEKTPRRKAKFCEGGDKF